MPFTILRQDITKMKVDAIVNAANTDLLMGGGVCGAIFKGAGPEKLQEACKKLAPIEVGEAVITPAFDLATKYIIHAAGPVYSRDKKEESREKLSLAYTNSLKLALENQCESIAFPLMSTGIYGYPKEEALRVASSAIRDFLKDNDLDVSLLVYDKSAFSISQDLVGQVETYIDEYYISSLGSEERQVLKIEEEALRKNLFFGDRIGSPLKELKGLEDLMTSLDEPFSKMLLKLIDARGMTDVEVYKAANLDRRLFSKIKNQKGYMPSKKTSLALALALKLNLEETDAFLERAGYALSHAVKFDLIIEYFIIRETYDIFEINEVLFHYDQPLLGGR